LIIEKILDTFKISIHEVSKITFDNRDDYNMNDLLEEEISEITIHSIENGNVCDNDFKERYIKYKNERDEHLEQFDEEYNDSDEESDSSSSSSDEEESNGSNRDYEHEYDPQIYFDFNLIAEQINEIYQFQNPNDLHQTILNIAFMNALLGPEVYEDDYDSQSYEDMLNLDENNVQKIVSEQEWNSFHHLKYGKYIKSENYKSSNVKIESCTICMSDFEVDDIITLVKCEHYFHKDCIKTWFDQKNTCPVCRIEVCNGILVNNDEPVLENLINTILHPHNEQN